jgi:hypothetical protein
MKKKWLLLISVGLALVLVTALAGCMLTSTPNPAPTSTNQQPIDVVSVSGPLPPINPGGPIVEITLKNVSSKPVISLATTIELGRSFNFNFDVSSSNPLLPSKSISSRLTLIGGGFSDNISYPLMINGILEDGAVFAYTRQVQIAAPAQTPTPATFNQTSANTTSKNDLSLSLSINSTSLHPGDQISVTIDEKNTLTIENNVPAANGWPVQGLNVGPCGTVNYPFGISIVQEYYDTKSVASVTPLRLYDPNAIYHCPDILAGITSYDFQPSSDNANIYTSYNSEPLTIAMTAEVSAKGFWSPGSKSTFSNFTPGIYTVVAGDEWGALIVLHFIVS